jgi:hypothetical protein
LPSLWLLKAIFPFSPGKVANAEEGWLGTIGDNMIVPEEKIATLTVVAMGIISLLAPTHLLSAGQEAFATRSDDNDDHQYDKRHDDKKDDNGSEIPPAYIAINGELSELQLENGPSGDDDSIADYDRDPQGTLSFGEHFSLLVPQGSGVLNVESAPTFCK